MIIGKFTLILELISPHLKYWTQICYIVRVLDEDNTSGCGVLFSLILCYQNEICIHNKLHSFVTTIRNKLFIRLLLYLLHDQLSGLSRGLCNSTYNILQRLYNLRLYETMVLNNAYLRYDSFELWGTRCESVTIDNCEYL